MLLCHCPWRDYSNASTNARSPFASTSIMQSTQAIKDAPALVGSAFSFAKPF
ncbi:MAG: hypothetical protein H7Z77_00250 [Chitinophagaceae bacterium]|nr:hypothetical protein [Polaromonas sp.]